MKLKLNYILICLFSCLFINISASAKIYQVDGEYNQLQVQVGDEIILPGGDISIRIRYISASPSSVRYSFKKKMPKDFIYRIPEKSLNYFSNLPHASYIAYHGAYVYLESVAADSSYAVLDIFNNCIPILKICLEEGDPLRCDAICDKGDLPHLLYDAEGKIIVSAPEGYERLARLSLINALNCLKKLESATGVQSEVPITLAYSEVSNPNPYALWCGYANSQERFTCNTNESFNDQNIEKYPYFEILEKWITDGGACMNVYGTPIRNVVHEMTHRFAYQNFKAFERMFFDEGFATLMQQELIDETSEIPDSQQAHLICYKDSYRMDVWPPGVTESYKEMGPGERRTGACMLRMLREQYGISDFISYFKNAAHYYCLDPNFPGFKDIYLWKDFIHPITGEDSFWLYYQPVFYPSSIEEPFTSWPCFEK